MPRAGMVIPPDLIEDYLEGRATQRELAAKIGVSRETIARALRRQGVSGAKRAASGRRGPNLTDEIRTRAAKIARAFFYSGHTYEQIAKEHGITRQRAHQIVSQFKARLGMDRVGWLNTAPCTGCGDLVAAVRITPPAYCYRCWLQLPPAIQAEGSTREEHDAQ